MRLLFLLLSATFMLLAEEKIPLNDDAPIKLVHWQNALKEVQPDSNAQATPPIKAVQTTLTFEMPFNKTPKIMEVEGQKMIVLKNAKLDSKKTMDFKEASLKSMVFLESSLAFFKTIIFCPSTSMILGVLLKGISKVSVVCTAFIGGVA
ncbi:hypothetical protein TH0274_09750 [Helicobacter pylori]